MEDIGEQLRVYFYINGAQAGIAHFSNQEAIDNGGSFSDLIFGQQSGEFNKFEGLMDDVAIWNSALADGAIAALYNGGNPLVNSGDYNAADSLAGDEHGGYLLEGQVPRRLRGVAFLLNSPAFPAI